VRRRRLRLAVAGVFLLAAALLVPLPWTDWPSHVLVGWVVGVAAFCVPILRLVHRLDARGTAEHAADSEGGRTETDVVVVLASVASLGAVGVMLARGAGGGPASLLQAGLALLAVAASWVAVHTVYTLRYARHYLVNEPGCVDFDADGPPRLSDFAYLSFTLGMTYQVSDTSLRTSAVRLLVLRHTLLSYVFGTVVIATTINLVVGLAGSGGGSG
jgi:uncharacterized membrane protein